MYVIEKPPQFSQIWPCEWLLFTKAVENWKCAKLTGSHEWCDSPTKPLWSHRERRRRERGIFEGFTMCIILKPLNFPPRLAFWVTSIHKSIWKLKVRTSSRTVVFACLPNKTTVKTSRASEAQTKKFGVTISPGFNLISDLHWQKQSMRVRQTHWVSRKWLVSCQHNRTTVKTLQASEARARKIYGFSMYTIEKPLSFQRYSLVGDLHSKKRSKTESVSIALRRERSFFAHLRNKTTVKASRAPKVWARKIAGFSYIWSKNAEFPPVWSREWPTLTTPIENCKSAKRTGSRMVHF